MDNSSKTKQIKSYNHTSAYTEQLTELLMLMRLQLFLNIADSHDTKLATEYTRYLRLTCTA